MSKDPILHKTGMWSFGVTVNQTAFGKGSYVGDLFQSQNQVFHPFKQFQLFFVGVTIIVVIGRNINGIPIVLYALLWCIFDDQGPGPIGLIPFGFGYTRSPNLI